jgi:ABC-2 type transport system ATP-binding protein
MRLTVEHLRAGYGSQLVLDDVSLQIAPGEWYALLGPNGCGKTTLLDCIVGRLAPAGGTLCIDAHSLLTEPLLAKAGLGYGCPPEDLPGLLTARQCMEVHAGAKGLAEVDPEVLEFAEELAFTAYLDASVDTLSLGTRQKLSLLLCLIGDPRLIVLDEAFNGLDLKSAWVVKRLLRARLEQRHASLLLATHALDIVEQHADRAGLLLEGRMSREWTQAEIRALAASAQGFDAALARSLDA